VADADGTRRVKLEVVPQGPLAIGHQQDASPNAKGVVTILSPGVGAGDATPTGVSQTFLAVPFHLRAEQPAAPAPATIIGTLVTVPTGADAEVDVPVPAGAAEPLPVVPIPVPASRRTVQVLFGWEEPLHSNQEPARVVYPFTGTPGAIDAAEHEAAALEMAIGLGAREEVPGADATARLRAWIATLGPPAGSRTYALVGRTDDLWYASNQAENAGNNDGLAQARLDKTKAALIAAGAAPGSIVARRESAAAFTPAPPAGALANAPPRILGGGGGGGRLALPTAQVTTPPGATAPVWNGRWNPDAVNTAVHQAAKDDSRRPAYRCVEIHAADSGAPPPPGGNTTSVRMLVPGPDGPPAPAALTTTSGPPPTDYRVRLRVKWDSPTVVTLADAVPTEVETLVAWKTAQVEVPGLAQPIPAPTGQDYWEVLLGWTYDSRTGQTEASGSLSLPDGTVNIGSNALAGAVAIGPALTAMLAPSDTIVDPLGQFVLAAAMVAAGALIGEAINSGAGATPSRVDIDRFAISYKWNGAAHVAATLDYTVDLHVNVSIAGAGSLVGQLRLKYKGVGLRFDGKPGGGLAGVALTYDGLSVEVVDPGAWSLGGPLGNLIRIAASRMGNGSQWMEFDLEFALDLGVVRLEGARIRLDLDPFKVEFRGLAASIDIPGTLRGRGSVTIGDGGAFRALLAIEVIPAKLGADGALAVDHDFVSIEVGVQLPVGIPLGGTGFGIFGFMGRFVANGTRNLDGLPAGGDPVDRQLAWYERPPQDKYKPLSGQYAFGVGAVIGTLPDSAFTFNAEGSLTIGFPDVSVIFGIDAHLISPRKTAATATGTASSSTFRILGMVLIEPDSIMVAVRANYEIPKVLKLEIPISAYFPLAGGDAWYIRIGSDNHVTRPGDPVTLTLLPGTLDVRAWAFVMIEERKLLGLGGTLVMLNFGTPLDFHGFSIGMGAGFDLNWRAGPISLEITAFLLLGIGTKPLLFAGAAGVRGELDLVVISVGVDGVAHFHVSPGYAFVEGHFCAHVDCFLFEISGCVDIRIGDDAPSGIPAPDSPLAGLDLCDHLAAVKGRASHGANEAVPVVWPDTVAVLRFAHYAEDCLGAAADFDRKLPSPAALSPWSGSTELKYAFRLNALALWKLTGADADAAADWTKVSGPFDSAWWLPTHRAAVIQGGDTPGPSTEEGRELGLFSWDPRAWSRWLGEGSQNLPGDPANTVADVCDPAAPADASCAYGKDHAFAAGHLGGFKATPAAGSAFPSSFTVHADFDTTADITTLVALGTAAGWAWLPGGVAPLHGAALVHGATLAAGWRFPAWQQTGQLLATAPMRLGASKPLLEAELVLEVCAERRAADLPGDSVCDRMPDRDGTIGGFTGKSATQYEGRTMLAFASGRERALRLQGGMMVGAHPGATDKVAVDLDPARGSATLLAQAADGSTLGSAATTGSGRQRLAVAAKGIARLTLRGTDQPVVFEVCWGSGRPAILAVVDIKPLAAPLVVATDLHGKTLVLEGTLLASPAPPPTTFVPRICPKYLFKLPPGDGWTHVTVAPWMLGDISLVALCGVTLEAATAQQADTGYRDALKGLLLELVDKAATDQPTHTVYLDAASTYEIRVGWQWQGWQPSQYIPVPFPPSDWTDAAEERFRFATAAFGLAPPPPPVAGSSLDADPAQGGPGYDERSFDPRGIVRFITRAAPSLEDPPHFLDDHMGFWFMADHLEKLVEKYDRILQVNVLHTRQPPGALHAAPPHVAGSRHLLDVTTSVARSIDTLSWYAADHRLVLAAAAAPCIGGAPALGSSSVSVTANLLPHSEYDLLLNAVPKTVGAFAETPIARNHFRTSRYRNPTGMLRALGFAAPLGLAPPHDAIAAGPLGGGALQLGDTAMDAALTTLGLDPWPLPPGPRTTVLWLPPAAGQPWRVAAVLLEADEPIWRAGFLTGAEGEPVPPPRLEVLSLTLFRTFEAKKIVVVPGQPGFGSPVTKRVALGTLVERVRNAAATRLILTPAVPLAVATGRLYDLELRFRENGVAGAKGRATMRDRPLTVAQEGR